jgi:hypothetical protein
VGVEPHARAPLVQQRIDADWVLAEAKGEKGKVPIAYLLIPNKS